MQQQEDAEEESSEESRWVEQMIAMGRVPVLMPQLPQRIQDLIHAHFKKVNALPPCPRCGSTEKVNFRYLNNKTRSRTLQPRYSCRNLSCVRIDQAAGEDVEEVEGKGNGRIKRRRRAKISAIGGSSSALFFHFTVNSHRRRMKEELLLAGGSAKSKKKKPKKRKAAAAAVDCGWGEYIYNQEMEAAAGIGSVGEFSASPRRVEEAMDTSGEAIREEQEELLQVLLQQDEEEGSSSWTSDATSTSTTTISAYDDYCYLQTINPNPNPSMNTYHDYLYYYAAAATTTTTTTTTNPSYTHSTNLSSHLGTTPSNSWLEFEPSTIYNHHHHHNQGVDSDMNNIPLVAYHMAVAPLVDCLISDEEVGLPHNPPLQQSYDVNALHPHVDLFQINDLDPLFQNVIELDIPNLMGLVSDGSTEFVFHHD